MKDCELVFDYVLLLHYNSYLATVNLINKKDKKCF